MFGQSDHLSSYFGLSSLAALSPSTKLHFSNSAAKASLSSADAPTKSTASPVVALEALAAAGNGVFLKRLPLCAFVASSVCTNRLEEQHADMSMC